MKQEEKDILLKDLCARLPYRVKVKITSIASKNRIVNLNENNICHLTNSWWRECKPYLFPLSSMTEEQKKEINKITNGSVAISKNFFYDLCNCSKIYHFDVIAVIDWLNKNHFDYRDLIEKGLAINATGLNIY